MTATGFAVGGCIGEKNGAGDANWVRAQQNGQAVRTAPGFAAGAALAKNGAGDADWVQAQPGDRFQ